MFKQSLLPTQVQHCRHETTKAILSAPILATYKSGSLWFATGDTDVKNALRASV